MVLGALVRLKLRCVANPFPSDEFWRQLNRSTFIFVEFPQLHPSSNHPNLDLLCSSGPEFFTRKVTDYLMRKGYPEESIIKL